MLGDTIFFDQMNRKVVLPVYPPRRIVSLVPSQTELLYYLGLHEEVVGITKFCIHPPEWFQTKTRVGGTKNFSVNKILQLKPHLVIGNKEENTQEGIIMLEKQAPVWMSNITQLSDALQMITAIGNLTQTPLAAQKLAQKITTAFSLIEKPVKPLRVVYLIWQNPFMAAGYHTFIHAILTQVCGFFNALPPKAERYPALTYEELQTLQPDMVFLSSEPYPFKQKHAAAIQQLLPNAFVTLVDGEMFSWYGSRLLLTATYFKQLLAEVNARLG